MNTPANYRVAVLQALQRAQAAGFTGLASALSAILQLEDKRADRYSIPPLDSVKPPEKP